VSGSTIFVRPQDTLPLRNVPVITPDVDWTAEALDSAAIVVAVQRALRRLDLHEGNAAVALCYRWAGAATFDRLDAFCRGVIGGLEVTLQRGLPLVLVGEGDIGGLVGIHCALELQLANPIASIDAVTLSEFDFIDIGALLETSGAVPVVIKSLVFPDSARVGRRV